MKAKLYDIHLGVNSAYVTLEVPKTEAERIHSLRGKDLDAEIKEHKEKRSRDANALMWACLSEIAQAIQTDKWAVYLQMLRRYGKFTHICVKPEAVEAIKKQWRECETVGDITINGKPAVQLLCYYGSSNYNSKEFSVLLDGIISEMREMGLEPPPSEEMRAALERLEEGQ